MQLYLSEDQESAPKLFWVRPNIIKDPLSALYVSNVYCNMRFIDLKESRTFIHQSNETATAFS